MSSVPVLLVVIIGPCLAVTCRIAMFPITILQLPLITPVTDTIIKIKSVLPNLPDRLLKVRGDDGGLIGVEPARK